MQPELLYLNIPGNDAIAISPHRLACYQWGGESAAQTILCAHGLTRNGRDFDFLADALANSGYRVLCPDMPGRGKSDMLVNPLGYNYQTYVADIMVLLAALKLPRVHWIGTSMGGIIGMMLANTLPGCIQSLALNDIGSIVSAEGLKRILTYAGVKMRFENRAQAEAELRTICAPFGIRDESHWRHLFTHSLIETPDGVRFAYDPAITASLPKDNIQDINLWSLWPEVTKIPTLLIRGAQSDLLTRETALSMQSLHPHLQLYEIEDAGHAPALMDGAQVARVAQWVNSNAN